MVKKLMDLNFKIGGKGFIYLMDAIELKKENILMPIEEICEAIAIKRNSTKQKVISSIRYIRETSDNKYKEYTNNAMLVELALLI